MKSFKSKSTKLLWLSLLVVVGQGFVLIRTEPASRAPHRIQSRRPQQLRITDQQSLLFASTLLESEITDPGLLQIPSTASPKEQMVTLSDWDTWWIQKLEVWYARALAIKCPFLRRRISDLLDAFDMVLRHAVVRDLNRIPVAHRCEGDACHKILGLSLAELALEIRKDWREETKKGYYITGKLNTALYRDDCLFDGPDPDMPVHGLRKYLNAASQLFDPSKSSSELLSLQVEGHVIVARWRMQGRLRLPWKPRLPVVTGTTTYHTDTNGLIYLHEETWDISVFRAFLETFRPKMARKIWKSGSSRDTL